MDFRRTIPFPTACLLLIACASAYGDEGLTTALGECRQIGDDQARLSCFDAVAAMAARQTTAPPTAPSLGTVPAGPPAAPSLGTVPTGPPSAPGLETVSATPPAAASPPSEASTAPADTIPLTDEVGIERVDGARQSAPSKYSARVTRCEVNRQSGQTYFYLENGQVWKQANYRRLNLRDCRFDVTLAKDTFGYELFIAEENRTVRVSRIR